MNKNIKFIKIFKLIKIYVESIHTYGLTLSAPIIFLKQMPTEHALESINNAAMDINSRIAIVVSGRS